MRVRPGSGPQGASHRGEPNPGRSREGTSDGPLQGCGPTRILTSASHQGEPVVGSFLSFTVEVFDSLRPGSHRLADFQQLPTACTAARLALDDTRVSLAVVRDRDGVMRFAVDRRREWSDGEL